MTANWIECNGMSLSCCSDAKRVSESDPSARRQQQVDLPSLPPCSFNLLDWQNDLWAGDAALQPKSLASIPRNRQEYRQHLNFYSLVMEHHPHVVCEVTAWKVKLEKIWLVLLPRYINYDNLHFTANIHCVVTKLRKWLIMVCGF